MTMDKQEQGRRDGDWIVRAIVFCLIVYVLASCMGCRSVTERRLTINIFSPGAVTCNHSQSEQGKVVNVDADAEVPLL